MSRCKGCKLDRKIITLRSTFTNGDWINIDACYPCIERAIRGRVR